MPAVESQMLLLGTQAPTFTLPDPDGTLHSLRNERIGGTHANYVAALKLTEKTRQDRSTHSPMRCFSFFFAFFAAFFSLAVMAGCFLVSLLLFCCLPMVLAFALN